MRLAIKFTRKGMSKYISHLDMQRLFARLFKRAGLPVKYSNGFNPHINMSFASALSVGMETEGDYLEVVLEEQMDANTALELMRKNAPDGIYIEKCGEIIEGAPKLMAAVFCAEYEFFADDEAAFRDAFNALLREESCIVVKKKDRKTKEIDIRPLIYSVDFSGEHAKAVLAFSGEKSLSASVLISEILKRTDRELVVGIVRKELFAKPEGEAVHLEKLIK